jgi:SAM-dependent methyltransferase
MATYFDESRSVWEHLGATDPMWAVLTVPAKRGGRWGAEEFFSTGLVDARLITDLLARNELELGKSIVDFGCGLGRLTKAFAELGHRVLGIDIAESMIDGARSYHHGDDRVAFTSYSGGLLPLADNSVDGVVSLRVLQHIPPGAKLLALAELVRVTREGGVVVVQLVDAKPRRRLSERDSRAWIEVLRAPRELRPGGRCSVRVRVTNTGGAEWSAGADIKLANHWLRDGCRVVLDDGRTPLPHTLAPGQCVHLDLVVRAPDAPGEHILRLDMVQEFVRWFADAGSPSTDLPVRIGETSGEPPSPPAEEPGSAGIKMYPIPDALVRDVVEWLGAEVVVAECDSFGGPEWISRTYVIRA